MLKCYLWHLYTAADLETVRLYADRAGGYSQPELELCWIWVPERSATMLEILYPDLVRYPVRDHT
jgi:hypothetical protein